MPNNLDNETLKKLNAYSLKCKSVYVAEYFLLSPYQPEEECRTVKWRNAVMWLMEDAKFEKAMKEEYAEHLDGTSGSDEEFDDFCIEHAERMAIELDYRIFKNAVTKE